VIYLASPYSHPDPAVRETRFRAACRAAAALIRAGSIVYAPVVHGHPLVRYGLPTDWSFWQPSARAFIKRCDELVVLPLPGWESSEGIKAEIANAAELGKPVRRLESTLGHVGVTLAHVGPEAGS
jgi:Domain of unknown function (DUF1937)